MTPTWAASVGPADIDCAFSQTWEARPPSPPMKGKDLVRTTGVLCLYPYFDPDGRDPLVARPPHRIELSPAQVAAINADLEQATLRERSTAAKPGACRQTRWTLVLRLRTPGVHPLGPDPDLMSTCTDEFVLATTNLRWELKPDTADVIASLLPGN